MFGIKRFTQEEFSLYAASIVLTGLAVALRFYCKIRHKQGVHADDYWILGGLLWYWASTAVGLWGMLILSICEAPESLTIPAELTGNGGAEMVELAAIARKNPLELKKYQNYFEASTGREQRLYSC